LRLEIPEEAHVFVRIQTISIIASYRCDEAIPPFPGADNMWGKAGKL
jgi:hypothetical protein